MTSPTRLSRLVIEIAPFAKQPFPDDLQGSVTFTSGGAQLTHNLTPRQCHELRQLVQPYFGEYVNRLVKVLGEGEEK
jgi:hypothetical protein